MPEKTSIEDLLSEDDADVLDAKEIIHTQPDGLKVVLWSVFMESKK